MRREAATRRFIPTVNTGYFGLPVAISLFGPDIAGLVLLAVLGCVLYEVTFGFFMIARGNYTLNESIHKLIKLPAIYAFALAVILNFSGFNPTQGILDFSTLFRGSYTVLGMMLIGLGLSEISVYKFDIKFLTITFIAKFIAWPLVMLSIIYLDNSIFNFFTTEIHNVMLLLSIVPMAANTVAYATELKVHPEKAALAVILSTIFALFFIPIVSMMYFN